MSNPESAKVPDLLRLNAVRTGLVLLIVGCSFVGSSPSPAPPSKLVVISHDSFAISETVVDMFEAANGVTVEILEGGDAGEMVNKAILTRDVPLADVLYGVDNTFLSRALDADIFEP